MLVERSLGGRPGIGDAVVAGHPGDHSGELAEPVPPGAEPGAEHTEGVAGAAQRVAAVVVGSVGVVVDGPEQACGA
jgi:hypothetical protein